MSLSGKRVVVIGGTSGIGFAVAELAQQQGAEVVVVSSSAAKVDKAKSRLQGKATGHAVDLSKEEAIKTLFDQIGAFDHLVYTAGDPLALEELAVVDLQKARLQFDVRYWGAVSAVKYGGPKIRSGGSIVLSSGMASRKPRKTWTITSSICGAMEALTRALAVELAPLRVNLVCPGLVKTELWDGMPDANRKAMYDRAASTLPAAHAGEATEVAEAYVYLMKAGFTTGSVNVVDGGASLV